MLNAGARECPSLPSDATRAPATITERFTVLERLAVAALLVRLQGVSEQLFWDVHSQGVCL